MGNMDDEGNGYASVHDTAEGLHVSTGTLRGWIKAGWIDAIKPGGKFGHIRVSLKSVKQFLDDHTIGKKGKESDPDG